jgi:hypothetical protein
MEVEILLLKILTECYTNFRGSIQSILDATAFSMNVL